MLIIYLGIINNPNSTANGQWKSISGTRSMVTQPSSLLTVLSQTLQTSCSRQEYQLIATSGKAISLRAPSSSSSFFPSLPSSCSTSAWGSPSAGGRTSPSAAMKSNRRSSGEDLVRRNYCSNHRSMTTQKSFDICHGDVEVNPRPSEGIPQNQIGSDLASKQLQVVQLVQVEQQTAEVRRRS